MTALSIKLIQRKSVFASLTPEKKFYQLIKTEIHLSKLLLCAARCISRNSKKLGCGFFGEGFIMQKN
jgi:hypothetical protein